MIVYRTPKHPLFNYAECAELYYKCQKDLGTDEDFDTILKNSDFYAFYEWSRNIFLGCAYYYRVGKRLLVNGFGTRGHHLHNMDCFKASLQWYDEDIYARALHLTSKICLRESGFEKLKGNLYIYRRDKWAELHHQAAQVKHNQDHRQQTTRSTQQKQIGSEIRQPISKKVLRVSKRITT